MPRRMIVSGLFFLILTPCRLWAQTTAPATLPTELAASTQPSAAIDLTTPRGALKVFFTADAGSDGAALSSVLLPDGASQQHMVTALADQKTADRELTDALKAKFPDQWKTDPRQEQMQQLPGVYDTIDRAEQTQDGDTATLKVGGGEGSPLTLKKVNGQWRIPLAALIQSVDDGKLDSDAHQIDIQVKVMNSAASDVAAGKYATQESAVEDIKKRMMTAAVDDHAAAKQATGQATGQATTQP
jgi:hypothetical protein